MTSLLALVALGFFLGMRHATDPDHVIAVTTIVARQKTPTGAAAIGAAWGVGHTLTILVVGGGIILGGWVIPPRIGLSMEFSVGVMLVLLGFLNLSGVKKQSPLDSLDRTLGAARGYQLVRPLVVGIVHGLAGSAAVALLVLTTIRNPAWAIWYLLVFGIGTIFGMMLMTAMIAFPFTRTTNPLARVENGFRLASGLISVAFGLFVAYRTGFVDGLFTSAPHWTPE